MRERLECFPRITTAALRDGFAPLLGLPDLGVALVRIGLDLVSL
jgi:hypothetical protein